MVFNKQMSRNWDENEWNKSLHSYGCAWVGLVVDVHVKGMAVPGFKHSDGGG